MTITAAPDVDAEDLAELVETLEELQVIAPAARPVALRVGGRGRSSATAGQIRIAARDVGQPWARGTLAHEYGHVLDPEGWAGLLRRAARLAVPLLPLLASSAALKLTGHGLWSVALLVLSVLVFVRAFAGTAAASRAQEYRADRRAAELVGREPVEAMLTQIHAEHSDRAWWLWRHLDTHPHPAERLAAIRS